MSGICFRSIPLSNKDYAISFSDVGSFKIVEDECTSHQVLGCVSRDGN